MDRAMVRRARQSVAESADVVGLRSAPGQSTQQSLRYIVELCPLFGCQEIHILAHRNASVLDEPARPRPAARGQVQSHRAAILSGATLDKPNNIQLIDQSNSGGMG